MSIARINSVEFETAEQLQKRMRYLEDNSDELTALAKAECPIQIQTSDTTLLGILIYPDEKTADEALEIRKRIMSSTKQKDSWYINGDLIHFRINKTIY